MPHVDPAVLDCELDAAVEIRSTHVGHLAAQPRESRRGRMTVGVVPARGDDRDPGRCCLEESVRRRRRTPVMRHLEDVHVRETARDQGRVDVVLDVPRQQQPARADLRQEHDRDVVDLAPRGARLGGHGSEVRPEHGHAKLAERDPGARAEDSPSNSVAADTLVPGDPARAGARHARL